MLVYNAVARREQMVEKRKRRIGKGKIIIFVGVLLPFFIFLFNYYASSTYYGIIEIIELKRDNNEYVVVIEGDFGVEKSIFNEKDTFKIIENDNEDIRVGNITEIWNDLSENKSFHVLIEAYENRNDFVLVSIYLD